MSQNFKFLKTTDKMTADKLIALGFQLISCDSNVWTFLNAPTLNFEQVDGKKVRYSNMLSL